MQSLISIKLILNRRLETASTRAKPLNLLLVRLRGLCLRSFMISNRQGYKKFMYNQDAPGGDFQL